MIRRFINQLGTPRSLGQDSQCCERILNVFLLSAMALFGTALVLSSVLSIFHPDTQRNELLVIIMLGIVVVLALLYLASRAGFHTVSAYILVDTFFVIGFYIGYRWGIGVGTALLMYALVILMAGVLISSTFAFVQTVLVGTALILLDRLQSIGILSVDPDWQTQVWYQDGLLMTVVIFAMIAVIVWLSGRGSACSLAPIYHSPLVVEKGHDRIERLYHLAELGRLSAGLFHDLMNPLTAVLLNIERIKIETTGISPVVTYIDHALVAAKRMGRLISAARNQIKNKNEIKPFSLGDEIQQVLHILSYQARLARVSFEYIQGAVPFVVGDPIKWGQVMLNIVANAIDAYADVDTPIRTIQIRLISTETAICCTITDHGTGISPENLSRIFEPFFTTKGAQHGAGIGIGLSITKDIIEKDFNGTVTVTSTAESGTVFSILLPI